MQNTKEEIRKPGVHKDLILRIKTTGNVLATELLNVANDAAKDTWSLMPRETEELKA